MRSLLILLTALALSLGGPTLRPVAADQAFRNPQILIEPEELARHLGDSQVRLIDLRGPTDRRQGEALYRQGHLPRAVFLHWPDLDDVAMNAEGFPLDPKRAGDLFGRLGVDDQTWVVAYDDAGGLFASRVFFVLEFFGHAKVRLLNGGLDRWRAEGRPLSRDPVEVPPRPFVTWPQSDLLVTAEWVKAHLGDLGVVLVDARSPAEYRGEDVRAKRSGHIPGAVNIDWQTTVASDRRWRQAKELRDAFAEQGVTPDKLVVTYCSTGVRAAHDYVALRLLGYERVRVYDGSWQEWGNRSDLPVKR